MKDIQDNTEPSRPSVLILTILIQIPEFSNGIPSIRANEIILKARYIIMELLLKRITFDKNILSGKPTIRGLRISVDMILDLLAKGVSENEILEDFVDLEPDDIRAALCYAHSLIAGEDVDFRTIETTAEANI